MLYFYGNDVKDAYSHPPVRIETAQQLQQYRDNYNVVILAECEVTDERKAEMLDELIGWALEHDAEFIECFISAAGMSEEEAHMLELA